MAGPGTRALQFRSKVPKKAAFWPAGLGSSFSRKRPEMRRLQPPPNSHTLESWGPRLTCPDPVQLRALASGKPCTPRRTRTPSKLRRPAETLTHLTPESRTRGSDSSSFQRWLSRILNCERLRMVAGGARRAENSRSAAALIAPGRSHERWAELLGRGGVRGTTPTGEGCPCAEAL